MGDNLSRATPPWASPITGGKFTLPPEKKPKLGASPTGRRPWVALVFYGKKRSFASKATLPFHTLVSTRGRLRRPLYEVETKGQGLALGGKGV